MNFRTCICFLAGALGVAACDPSEDAWRESAVAAGPSSEPLLSLCTELPDEAAPREQLPNDRPALTDAPHVAEGVCQSGYYDYKYEEKGCDTCIFSAGNPGQKIDVYRRWCYNAPSPPSCGCEGWEYQFYSCSDDC